MLAKIKDKIESELASYLPRIDKSYFLSRISPLLFMTIKDFISRGGKRARPVLFVIGYLGFAKRPAAGLYRTALSLELLHDFLLVHDDIIDKSATRRGKPSVHEALNKYIKNYNNNELPRFNGQDLTIVIGDIMYALAMAAFLAIKERAERKEKALKKFIESALYTASGEFIELLYGLKSLDKIKKPDIYKIYDYKTAYYTFAFPLTIGAILAGANQNQVSSLFEYGSRMGRAFQIKDDIMGVFGEEKKMGKSVLTDLQEAKKTILIWRAYNNSGRKNKRAIKNILSKMKVNEADLSRMREIITASGALDYARKEIASLIKKAEIINGYSRMRPKYKKLLFEYSLKLLE